MAFDASRLVSVPHDANSLLCSCSVQCTHCPSENTEKSWELCLKMQHNWAAFQTTSPPRAESAYGAWSQMMHSLQHILSVTLRAFLNFESVHGTADFVIALSPLRCSFLDKSLLLLWPHVSYRPVISTQTAASFLYAKLLLLFMSFVLTAAVKGHQEDYRIAFNQCAWWKHVQISHLL